MENIYNDNLQEIGLNDGEQIKNESDYMPFKKGGVLLYIGKCDRLKGIMGPNGEVWKDKDKILKRNYGFIVEYVEDEAIKCKTQPKIGDLAYIDIYTGIILPFKKNEDTMLYYKYVSIEDINILIKNK